MENASERYFYGDVLRRKHAMVEYRILLWLFYDLQPAKKNSKTFRSRPQNAKLLLAHKSLLKSLFPLRLDVKIYSLTNSTQVL